MHDDIQAFRFFEMNKCFADWQIPCRWIPDMGLQYGYPQFNFYPPIEYYMGEIFHLVFGLQFIDVTKLVFGLGFIVGGLGMYLFMKSWLGKWPAFVSALLFTYAPYRAVNVYVRGDMNESWALAIYPFIFWSVYQFIQTGRKKYGIIMAFSVAALITTHTLMTMIFLPVAIIWGIALIALYKKWTRLIPAALFGLLGIATASFFLLPVIFEKQYVHLDSIIGGYFDYRLHFADLNELFITNYWGYGSSVWGPKDELSLSTGQLHFLLGIIAFLLALFQFKKHKTLSTITITLFGLTLFILFLIHQKSSFIWSMFPFMAYLQFPWRFLSDTSFLLSLLGGVAIFYAEDIKLKVLKIKAEYWLGIIILLGVFILHGSFFQGHAWQNITDQDKFSGKSWDKQLTISIFDYLPIFATLPPTSPAPLKPELMDGEGQVVNWTKGSDWQYGEISVTRDVNVRLPLFDFPGMQVKVKPILNSRQTEYQVVEHKHDDCRGQEFCLGLISFPLSTGNYEVNVHLENTPIRTIGNVLTLVSLGILGLLGGLEWKRRKKRV